VYGTTSREAAADKASSWLVICMLIVLPVGRRVTVTVGCLNSRMDVSRWW
jgi:hypothetical protein